MGWVSPEMSFFAPDIGADRPLTTGIAGGVALVPAPSGFDGFVQVRVLRGPVQDLPSQRGVGHQFWRVAGTSLSHDFRDRVTGDISRGLNDLPHAGALAGAQVHANA